MRELLRSTFLTASADDRPGAIYNCTHLDASGYTFEIAEDQKLWSMIRDFYRAHGHAPEGRTIRDHFKALRDDGPLDRFEQIVNLRPVYGGDFIKGLEGLLRAKRERDLLNIFREATQIVQGGFKVKGPRGKEDLLQGPEDALRYVMSSGHRDILHQGGVKRSGDGLRDTADFVERYKKIQADPRAGVGVMSGIQQLDVTLSGARKGELWTHAAFTGHLKSTLLLNWFYNTVVYLGNSVVYFSLEMPYIQVRNLLMAMHSLHPKFNDARMGLGLQGSETIPVGLPYKGIREASLTPEEEEFLFQHVIADLDNCPDYGVLQIEQSDPGKSKYTVSDMRVRAELLFSAHPFQAIGIDHAGLPSPEGAYAGTTEKTNEVVRDSKRLAMDFDRGRGIAVINLFQINREGYSSALKIVEKSGSYAQGPYNLTHLSYANECERSSDVVSASYLDDRLRAEAKGLMQNLKTRDDGAFENFFVAVDWRTRRLLTCLDDPPKPAAPAPGGRRIEAADVL